MLAAATPAAAEEYIYNFLGRGDTVTLGAGEASRANIAIQHPTPWPPYVNDTNIKTPARQGVGALERMFNRYDADDSSAPSTVINVGTGGQN
jgi:hypothetical protein